MLTNSTPTEHLYCIAYATPFSNTLSATVIISSRAGKFFWYMLFVILNLAFFTNYGMLAVAITPNAQMAAVVSTSTYGLWFLFAGFVIPKPVSLSISSVLELPKWH